MVNGSSRFFRTEQSPMDYGDRSNQIPHGTNGRRRCNSFHRHLSEKMSGALGYAKEIGYEKWFMFEQKVTERFAPTHEAERTHKLMKLERYHGDIRQFLLRMENHNIKVGLQGVAWRDMLKAQMPEAGLLRLSFETYPNDELWLAGDQKCHDST